MILSSCAAQEYKSSPDYPKPHRGLERLASMTHSSASGDTKPRRSGTRAAPIQTRDVLSSLTFSSPLRELRNKIPPPHPGRGVLDKAGGLRHLTQGPLVSGLFRDVDVARRNHATVGEHLKERDLEKP